MVPEKSTAAGFDLTEAFQKFAINDPTYGPIIQTLRALESANSIYKDLLEAKEALDAGTSIKITKDFVAKSSAELVKLEAIFVHALMIYCKAVHSSTKARIKFDVLGSYSAEQIKAHRTVVSLRDEVIAHFGKGRKELGGLWNEDHVVLWRDKGRYRYSYPSQRAAHKAAIARILYELIHAAIARVEKYASQRQDKLMALLMEGMDRNPSLRTLIEQHPFDELKFFRGPPPFGSSERFCVSGEEIEKSG